MYALMYRYAEVMVRYEPKQYQRHHYRDNREMNLQKALYLNQSL